MKRLSEIRQVFLDMDGTIYHGETLFPSTIPFLEFLTKRGIGYAFLSNNSSFSKQEYVERLERMNLTVSPENFYLSTDYAIDYLHHFHPEYRKLYVLGMPLVRREFFQSGFTEEYHRPDAVIVTFDRSLDYERLCHTAYLLKNGTPGFATHPDVFCPTNRPTWLVDCGAITAALETSTGCKLNVLGKPDPGMLREAARRRHVKMQKTLMIGDRLATDIAVGVNAGSLTCHITGDGADPATSPNITADYTVENLGELQQLWLKQEAANHERI